MLKLNFEFEYPKFNSNPQMTQIHMSRLMEQSLKNSAFGMLSLWMVFSHVLPNNIKFSLHFL